MFYFDLPDRVVVGVVVARVVVLGISEIHNSIYYDKKNPDGITLSCSTSHF